MVRARLRAIKPKKQRNKWPVDWHSAFMPEVFGRPDARRPNFVPELMINRSDRLVKSRSL